MVSGDTSLLVGSLLLSRRHASTVLVYFIRCALHSQTQPPAMARSCAPPAPAPACCPTRALTAGRGSLGDWLPLGLSFGLPPCPPPVPPSREKEGCSQAGARVAVVRSARPEAWMANLRGPGTPCCDRAVLCLKRATVRDYPRRAPLKYARCLANPVETTRCQVDSQAGARAVVVRPLVLRLFESTDT